jgi:hypothetical protein
MLAQARMDAGATGAGENELVGAYTVTVCAKVIPSRHEMAGMRFEEREETAAPALSAFVTFARG